MDFYILIFIITSSIFIWLSIITSLILIQRNHYQHLIKDTKKRNLQEILEDIIQGQKKLHQHVEKNTLDIESVKKNSEYFLQHIGFSRFNPFSDTGGDQSFLLSLLDNKKNGIVFTFLHSRDTTRVYAKQVINGKSDKFPLSKEEEFVIASAVQSKL